MPLSVVKPIDQPDGRPAVDGKVTVNPSAVLKLDRTVPLSASVAAYPALAGIQPVSWPVAAFDPIRGPRVPGRAGQTILAAVRYQLGVFVVARAECQRREALPPARIEPEAGVTVMPLPLSLAKPIDQPDLTAPGAGEAAT